MTLKQACMRFEHPCGHLSSSQWRKALQSQGVLPEDVVVFQSSTAMSLTAKTTEASERLHDAALPVMRAVASVAGSTLSVELVEFTPAVAFTGYRWNYHVPCIAVARSGEEWGPWREQELSREYMDKLRERITSDLGKQLAAWDLSAQDLGIEIVSAGIPMVLKSAVANGPKPTSAMGRKAVVFSSAARMEGAFWVGLLQATGHGRVHRDGYQEKQS